MTGVQTCALPISSESRCDKNFEIEVKLMESKKNINGMDYVLAGDYYIPDLKLPNEEPI